MRGISNADYNYIEEQIEKYIDEGDHTEEEIEAKRRDLEEECFFTDDEEEVADALEDAGCSLMKFVRYDGVGNRYIRYGIDDRSGYLVGCIGDVGEMTLEEIREWMNQGEDLEEEQDNKDYIYYFYYHMTMSTAEILKIEECIKDHDFDAFLQFYYWYQINKLINPEGWTYFPDEIAVYGDHNEVEHISVFDRNNFNKITDTDCECG